MPRIAQIHSLDECRRRLARVYTLVKTEKLNASAGRTCIQALNSIARILRDNDLGGRLAALEEALAAAGVAVKRPSASAAVEPPDDAPGAE